MMSVTEILDLVKLRAKEDEAFRQALLDTAKKEKPVTGPEGTEVVPGTEGTMPGAAVAKVCTT